MSRPHQPWYWNKRQAWYTDFGGVRQKPVDGPNEAKTKRLAESAFHQLTAECLANPVVDDDDPTAASVIDDYLPQISLH